MPIISAERKAKVPVGWVMLALLTMAYAIAMIDRTILVLLIGPLQHDLHLSDTQFGMLQGLAFALFYVLAGFPIGFLIDRMPRVLIIAIGLAVWSVATILSALAGTFAMLFLARTGVAVGEATLNPATYSVLSNIYPKDRLGRAIGIFSTGAAIGTGSAYLIGGTLLSRHPGGAIVPVFGPLHVWQLAFLLAGLPGLILAALIAGQREPPRSPRPQSVAGNREWGAFFRSRRAALLYIYGASCCQTLLLYAFLTWSAALLLRGHGVSGGQAGLILGVMNVVLGIGGFMAGGMIADRWLRSGRRDAHMRVGFWAHVIILPAGLVATLAAPLVVVVPALCVVYFMQVATGPATIAALQLITPVQLRGRSSAILMISTTIAGVGLGPAIVALLNDHVFHAQAAVGRSMACVVAIVTPLAILLFQRGRAAVARAIDDQ